MFPVQVPNLVRMEGKTNIPQTRPLKASRKIFRKRRDSLDDDWEYSRSDESHEHDEFSALGEKISFESSSADSEDYPGLVEPCCKTRAERIRKTLGNYGWKDEFLNEPFRKPIDNTALLCKACGVFFTANNGENTYKHYHDLSSLKTAARRGCQFCTLIRTMIDAPHIEAKPAKDVHVRLGLSTSNAFIPLKSLDISVEYHLENGVLEHERAVLLPLSFIRPRDTEHRITSTTGSSENAVLSRKWLDNCTQSHPRCREARSQDGNSWIPNRLLHIDHPKPGMIRLEHSSEIPPKSRYLALSHCWGTTPTTKLLSDKYERARDGVPLYALPKTYRDAISVVRWFNAEYIWIDSLCIIQDSEEDWLRQSLTMKDVYKNSLCTIAATAATNSSEGCFFRRDIDFTRWAPIKLRRNSADDGEYHCVYPDLWKDNISDSPLNSRAWVLQERWLSPRVLHFARDQMYWECQDLSACERYPSGVSPEILQFLEDQSLKKSASLSVNTWMKLVQDYSHRGLTRGSDKLAAISGMSLELGEQTRQQYICGFWKPGIEAQLCWRVNVEIGSGNPPVRSREYRAPTWSWISIDGGVSFPYKPDMGPNNEEGKNFTSLVTIEDVSIQPPSHFAKITSAALTLRGFLQPIKWRGAHSVNQAGQVFVDGKMTKHIDLVFDDVASSSPPTHVLLLPLILVDKDLTYGLVVADATDNCSTAAVCDPPRCEGRTLCRFGWFEARSRLSTLRKLRANLSKQEKARSAASRQDPRCLIRLI